MRKAVSIYELMRRNFRTLPFEGVWKQFIGEPEVAGAWLIWGNSGQGKTHFSLQLAKYLSGFGRVYYNALEEGISESLRLAVKRERISSRTRITFLDKEPVTELKERLNRHKSPNIILIDSIQYTGMSYTDYKALRNEFPKKLFVFISHADGKEPAGRVAKSVRYDVDVKIRIEGYKAFVQSRYGGRGEYVIWQEGAERYWVE